MDYYDFEMNVVKWAHDRGLIANTTAQAQALKLGEEYGELARAVLHNDLETFRDSAGDMLVVMVNLCTKLGLSLEDCWEAAWSEIKDRQGEMVNGTFVKN